MIIFYLDDSNQPAYATAPAVVAWAHAQDAKAGQPEGRYTAAQAAKRIKLNVLEPSQELHTQAAKMHTHVNHWTRQEYLAGLCTFADYYGQFVTPGTLPSVARVIPLERIKASTCQHLNDIPLAQWDRLVGYPQGTVLLRCDRRLLEQCQGSRATFSDLICVAKIAANQYRGAAQ